MILNRLNLLNEDELAFLRFLVNMNNGMLMDLKEQPNNAAFFEKQIVQGDPNGVRQIQINDCINPTKANVERLTVT